MDEKPLDQLLTDLKCGLSSIYGERLKGLYLYGSYARGEADEESDLDILVVLDQFDSYAREVNSTGKLASDLSLKHGITVSKVFVREDEWLNGDTPFLHVTKRSLCENANADPSRLQETRKLLLYDPKSARVFKNLIAKTLHLM
jgi:predicted nucleotidyltransferase